MEVFSSEPFSLSREEHSLSNLSISLMGGWRYWYTWLLRKGVMVPGSYLEILAEFSQVSALTDVHTFGTFWLIFFFLKNSSSVFCDRGRGGWGWVGKGKRAPDFKQWRREPGGPNGLYRCQPAICWTDTSGALGLSRPCLTRIQCHSGGHLGSTQPRAIQSIISSTLVSSPAQGVMWFYI